MLRRLVLVGLCALVIGCAHYEEHEIRKITELLYLNHSDFIAAKLSARS